MKPRHLALIAATALILTGCASTPEPDPAEEASPKPTTEINPNIGACEDFEKDFHAMFQVAANIPSDEPGNSRNDEMLEYADNLETIAISAEDDTRDLMLAVVDSLPADESIHMVRWALYEGHQQMIDNVDRLGKQCTAEGYNWSLTLG